jgi:hypothetical protein
MAPVAGAPATKLMANGLPLIGVPLWRMCTLGEPAWGASPSASVYFTRKLKVVPGGPLLGSTPSLVYPVSLVKARVGALPAGTEKSAAVSAFLPKATHKLGTPRLSTVRACQ